MCSKDEMLHDYAFAQRFTPRWDYAQEKPMPLTFSLNSEQIVAIYDAQLQRAKAEIAYYEAQAAGSAVTRPNWLNSGWRCREDACALLDATIQKAAALQRRRDAVSPGGFWSLSSAELAEIEGCSGF